MNEVISYQAFDGTMFDNKQDCLRYENEQLFCREDIFHNIKFFDSNRKELYIPSPQNHWYNRTFENAYNEAAFLIIEDDLFPDTIEYIQDETNITIPSKKGEYRYDEYEGWVKLTDDFIAFCERWNITPNEMTQRFTKG